MALESMLKHAQDREEKTLRATGQRVRAVLFDSEGEDRLLNAPAELDGLVPSEKQLLWVDVLGADSTIAAQLAGLLSLPAKAQVALLGGQSYPRLVNGGKFFWLDVIAVKDEPGLRFQGSTLAILAGPNFVVSVHDEPIEFIDTLTAREAGETHLGSLSSASFTASLLDWHLSTYFAAVAQFELAVERLEVEVLSEHPRDCLNEMRELRKGASRLRRMLAPHRTVFAGLSRPDFRPQENAVADQHFLALDSRYEKAMDMVENARDLVVGSFELFSSQIAIATNLQMRVLTFATVVLGVLACMAGILGMNFDAPFFHTSATGFWIAVGAMMSLAIAALVIGKAKRWM
jgi:Mg2+ and Co2+ transporter CorA